MKEPPVSREGEAAPDTGLKPGGSDYAEQLHPDATTVASPMGTAERSH